MKVRSVVGGTGDTVILEVQDGLYAIVDTLKETVWYRWTWLFLAKYEPIYSPDQLNKEAIERAKQLVEKDSPDETEIYELQTAQDEADIGEIRRQQRKLIAMSKEQQKGIYLG